MSSSGAIEFVEALMESEITAMANPSRRPKLKLSEIERDMTLFCPKRFPLTGYINESEIDFESQEVRLDRSETDLNKAITNIALNMQKLPEEEPFWAEIGSQS